MDQSVSSEQDYIYEDKDENTIDDKWFVGVMIILLIY